MTSVFRNIIGASEEGLVQRFYKYKDDVTSMGNRLQDIAKKVGLRPEQLVCAIGFNPHSRYLTEIMPLLGYATFEELVKERNDIFTNDIYKRVSLDDVLAIYAAVKADPANLQVMQYLLKERLEHIERRIEETVNSLIIDKYKAEMRAIYSDGIADVDFADQRLNRRDSGFRALLNEVSIIIDSKLIPAGDIFFRDTILPEEKRKILSKGLIPRDLIQARLDDHNTSPDEKQVLVEYLKQHRAQ
jgi:tetrahydromethanopterin S-methyltransferase subunit G